MTAQQEPEYRITESELDEYEIRYPKVSPTEMYNKILSRPIQQTKDITPLIDRQSDAIDRLESDIAGLRDCIDRHDAAIRKEEREKVLDTKHKLRKKIHAAGHNFFESFNNLPILQNIAGEFQALNEEPSMISPSLKSEQLKRNHERPKPHLLPRKRRLGNPR